MSSSEYVKNFPTGMIDYHLWELISHCEYKHDLYAISEGLSADSTDSKSCILAKRSWYRFLRDYEIIDEHGEFKSSNLKEIADFTKKHKDNIKWYGVSKNRSNSGGYIRPEYKYYFKIVTHNRGTKYFRKFNYERDYRLVDCLVHDGIKS